jgi:hypothetical protein
VRWDPGLALVGGDRARCSLVVVFGCRPGAGVKVERPAGRATLTPARTGAHLCQGGSGARGELSTWELPRVREGAALSVRAGRPGLPRCSGLRSGDKMIDRVLVPGGVVLAAARSVVAVRVALAGAGGRNRVRFKTRVPLQISGFCGAT